VIRNIFGPVSIRKQIDYMMSVQKINEPSKIRNRINDIWTLVKYPNTNYIAFIGVEHLIGINRVSILVNYL
jgi:hypothetical protein